MDRKTKLESEEESKSFEGSFQRTNSFRKVLPSKPSSTVDSRLSMSLKMIDRPNVSGPSQNGNKMLLPFMLEYAIMAEYQMLQRQELTGMYVIPSDQDPLIWFGVVFIHQGLYKGGVFRFILQLPDTFPDGDFPSVTFESSMFHPAIDQETGQLNIADEFRQWNKKVHHVWHVLQYAKSIFFKIETKSPANVEASHLFVTDHPTFQQLAHNSAEASMNTLYDVPQTEFSDDINYIRFQPYSESVHDRVREQMTDPSTTDKIRNF